MGCGPALPSLQINYSHNFTLTISLSRAQEYSQARLQGVLEYFYRVTLRISHPSGHFEYQADEICFDREAFDHFASELKALNAGKTDQAILSEVGQMLSFKLKGRDTICMQRFYFASTNRRTKKQTSRQDLKSTTTYL